MDSLLSGVLMALVVRRYLRIGIQWIILPLLLWILTISVSTDLRHPVFQTLGFTINAFFFSSLILLSLSPSLPFYRILQVSVLKEIGKISYGLYIFHYPLLILFKHLYRASPHEKVWTSACTLLTSFLLAVISFNFFEKRWMNWRNKFLR
jgi:peptidoglycan/LPS O-acetylase OafA/YrhL